MPLFELIALLIFILSAGIFFSKRWGTNPFAWVAAGLFALVSSYFVIEELVERIERGQVEVQLPAVKKEAKAPVDVQPSPKASPFDKQQTVAVEPSGAAVQPVARPCGDAATAGSLSSRCAAPLSATEEHALKPKDSLKECDKG